jgi:hypothetical protein
MQLPVCKLHLSGRNEDLSILGCAQVVHHTHQLTRLCLGFLGLRYVQVHLIAIKVSIVRTADALVEAESPAANTAVLKPPGKDLHHNATASASKVAKPQKGNATIALFATPTQADNDLHSCMLSSAVAATEPGSSRYQAAVLHVQTAYQTPHRCEQNPISDSSMGRQQGPCSLHVVILIG